VSFPAPTVKIARGTPLPPADERGPFDQFSERLPAVLYWHGALSTVEGGHIQHASGDLDDDGQTDHIIADFGSVTSFRAVGKLDDRPVVVPVSVRPSQYWNNKVLVADVNGDHRQDLLFVFCYDLGQPCRARALRYRTRTHDFLFLPEVVLPWGLPAGQPLNPRISVADVNGDGLADLVARPLLTGDFRPGTLWNVEVALGRGDGTFDSVRSLTILMAPSIDDHFLIADQDGDGRDDLILVGATATVWNPHPRFDRRRLRIPLHLRGGAVL
jgi:hypothetical protein